MNGDMIFKLLTYGTGTVPALIVVIIYLYLRIIELERHRKAYWRELDGTDNPNSIRRQIEKIRLKLAENHIIVDD